MSQSGLNEMYRDEEDTDPAPKRTKKDSAWGDVHADAFVQLGLQWPPPAARLPDLKERTVRADSPDDQTTR